MKYPDLMRSCALAAAVGTGAVLAQTPTETSATTDVGPPPAEERSSTGAIVLENSLVRAQRDNAFQRSASQTGVTSVGPRRGARHLEGAIRSRLGQCA